jgi:hypothetical protein
MGIAPRQAEQKLVTLSSFFKLKFLHNSIQIIQINQPTRCNSFTSLLLDVYVCLNIFRAPLRPSSGAYNCTSGFTVKAWRLERCWPWYLNRMMMHGLMEVKPHVIYPDNMHIPVLKNIIIKIL